MHNKLLSRISSHFFVSSLLMRRSRRLEDSTNVIMPSQHGVGLADAMLAATAEAENAELKTLNTKHYPMFKGLRPTYTK